MKDHPDVNVITLTKFRADLARSLSRRADKLIESPNLREQVQALDPLEAYFIVKEVGLDSALPILRAATPEQLQTFVDLDCWDGDTPDISDLGVWLAAFADEGFESLAEAFLSLDEELQVWFLKETLVVWELAPEETIPDADREFRRFNTPDGNFSVDGKPDKDSEFDPLTLVDALYRNDVNGAYSLLQATRWELESTLAEQALHFRSGRVADLGFPARDEAVVLFSPPPAKPRAPVVSAHPAVATLPALYASPLLDRSLLAVALGTLTDEKLVGQVERDFLNLVNLAIVAYDESPRDVTHVGETAQTVRDTVSLGLESLKPGSDEAAGALLQSWSLVDLYRQGHQQLVPLQKRAGTASNDPVFKAWLDKNVDEREDYTQDRADREFIQTLVQTPPRIAGENTVGSSKPRAFATFEDVDAARTRLEAIIARVS